MGSQTLRHNWVTNTYLSFKQQNQYIVVRQQLHARHCFSTQINFQKQCTTCFLKTGGFKCHSSQTKLNTLIFIYTKSHPCHNYIFIILEWFKHPAKIGLAGQYFRADVKCWKGCYESFPMILVLNSLLDNFVESYFYSCMNPFNSLIHLIIIIHQLSCGFFSSSNSKESACYAGDSGSIPGSGRSPGEGNGNPF